MGGVDLDAVSVRRVGDLDDVGSRYRALWLAVFQVELKDRK